MLMFVARYEGRFVNRQIVRLLWKNIEEFEQNNGEIPQPSKTTDG